MPKSPCMASAACMNIAGVPVELNVATIFCAIIALFPMPVNITLAFRYKICCTISEKSSFNCVEIRFMPSASI